MSDFLVMLKRWLTGRYHRQLMSHVDMDDNYFRRYYLQSKRPRR